MISPERSFQLNSTAVKSGPVLYWIQRELRFSDNYSLMNAASFASAKRVPLIAVFIYDKKIYGNFLRHKLFIKQSLEELSKKLNSAGISLLIRSGDSLSLLNNLIKEVKCSALFTDFNPLSYPKSIRLSLANSAQIPVYETDSHNIVPCKLASSKLEFGAYTLRPKIKSQLDNFLIEYPEFEFMQNNSGVITEGFDAFSNEPADKSSPESQKFRGGEDEALSVLQEFINKKLPGYSEKRNDPNQDSCSNLSPYLHFGNISAQRVALEVNKAAGATPDAESFLEELIVRKELSDNFCNYNSTYYSSDGFPDWAKKSLSLHLNDKREFLYSLDQFENSLTHDELWNAAQIQMTREGKMHGYMRMYWAKKILEWTQSPDEAFRISLYLNDKYSLDGNDPNGYTGIAWSIGGVHDRAWSERPVFGKIRYMNYNGCKRKFDVHSFIKKYLSL